MPSLHISALWWRLTLAQTLTTLQLSWVSVQVALFLANATLKLANLLTVFSYVFLTIVSAYTLSVRPNKYYSSPPDAINLLKPVIVPQKALLTSIKALNITNEARRTLNLNRKIPSERIKKTSDVATYHLIEKEADQLADAFGF